MTKEVVCLLACSPWICQTSLDLGFRRAEHSFLFIPSGPKDGTGVVLLMFISALTWSEGRLGDGGPVMSSVHSPSLSV